MQKIKKVIELFEWFCQNIIWLVMLCCVGFVAVLNLLYRSKVAYVWTEDVSIERTSITALVLAVLIFVVFLIAGSKIQKIDELHEIIKVSGRIKINPKNPTMQKELPVSKTIEKIRASYINYMIKLSKVLGTTLDDDEEELNDYE